jgi:hypothetical protein
MTSVERAVAARQPPLWQIEGARTVKKQTTKPIHHTPAFWIGIILCLAAIAIYLWSDDLSWQPRG